MKSTEQITVLQAFHKVLGQELHNIRKRPDILWQQMYNRLQWVDGEDDDGPVSKVIGPEFEKRIASFTKPWFHNKCMTRESETLMKVFKGHISSVYSCAFSPDGKTIASASLDTTLRLWDAKTSQEKAVLKGHSNPVNYCTFSPDGKILVSASADKAVRFWDVETGEEKAALRGQIDTINSCSFHPNGQIVASVGDDAKVHVWDVKSGKEKIVLKGLIGGIQFCTFSPDGKTILAGSDVGEVGLWDVKTGNEKYIISSETDDEFLTPMDMPSALCHDGKIIASISYDDEGNSIVRLADIEERIRRVALKGHLDDVISCSFSPDGRTIASTSGDGTVRLWDTNTGVERYVLTGHADWVNFSAFSPNGKMLVSGDMKGKIILWDIKYNPESICTVGHCDEVFSCSFSPGGERVATCGGYMDKRIRILKVNTEKDPIIFKGHLNAIRDCCFSPDGNELASASDDGTIKLWDANRGLELFTFEGGPVAQIGRNMISFSPDGMWFGSFSGWQKLKYWELATKVCHIIKDHEGSIYHGCFSPDSQMIASAGGKILKLWDTKTREAIRTFEGHKELINYCAFSPDGKIIATAGDDCTVRIWDTFNGKEVNVLCGHTDSVQYCSFIQDGKILSSVSADGNIKLWNPESGKEFVTLPGHSGGVNMFSSAMDGSILASSGRFDEIVKIWDVEMGRLIETYPCIGIVTCGDFSPLGNMISVGDSGGNVYILELIGFDIKRIKKRVFRLTKLFTTAMAILMAGGGYALTLLSPWFWLLGGPLILFAVITLFISLTTKIQPCPYCGKTIYYHPQESNGNSSLQCPGCKRSLTFEQLSRKTRKQ